MVAWICSGIDYMRCCRTEVGQLTVADIASDDPQDWQYVRFLDPNELHMIPESGTEGLYRMVVKVRLLFRLGGMKKTSVLIDE